MAKGIIDLFRRGFGGRIADLKPGPLTPGQRSPVPDRLRRKKKEERTDTDLRAIMAAQVGALPAILEPLRPRNSASFEFSVIAAKAYAKELGVTIFHLIEAGANVEGISRRELAEFVAETSEINKINENDQIYQIINKKDNNKKITISREKITEKDLDQLIDNSKSSNKDNGSPFF